MTTLNQHELRDLLVRARAALENPADLDDQADGKAKAYLIEDIALAEQGVTLSPIPWPVEIHIGIIENRGGLNIYSAIDRTVLDQEIAEFCREWWSEIDDPRKPEELDHASLIETYFDRHETECLTTELVRIEPPPATMPSAGEAYLERGRYCVLSTAHLTAATAELLDLWATWPPGDRPLDIAAAVHGWFVPTRIIDEAEAARLPEDLGALIRFGRERGFSYVLIDCDGDTVEGLEVHSW